MKQLFSLLEQGVTAAHVISYVKEDLLKDGFCELSLSDEWNLQENGKYYVNLYGSNSVAFTIGEKSTSVEGFRIAMAHSDYPLFQLKPNACMKGEHAVRFNVEIYGGMYQKSWLDRPLGVAGKIVVKGEDAFAPQVILYRSERPLCIIPSLAIHMDRECNKKGIVDTSKELVPLAALSKDADLLEEIAKNLQITKEDILDYDLYLYNMDTPEVVGLDASMIAAARLDNLSSVAAILSAIKQRKTGSNQVNVFAIFDHEEVGSLSKQGADSPLLSMILQKIGSSLQDNSFELIQVLQKSFLLSVDVAHAHHANYEEKSDVTNKAYLGAGFCIKKSVGQKYGTTAESAAVLKNLCEKAQIPYTIAINKTGISGGSTLGPIVTSHLPMPCADIGMPILAMHSASELGAVDDYHALKEILKEFYNAC